VKCYNSEVYDILRHLRSAFERYISGVSAHLESFVEESLLELNSRAKGDASDEHHDLREFMRAFGWPEHLPAIADEHGTILCGHRMVWIAEELGIKPVVKTVASTTTRTGSTSSAPSTRASSRSRRKT
jgi:hypothetical protein